VSPELVVADCAGGGAVAGVADARGACPGGEKFIGFAVAGSGFEPVRLTWLSDTRVRFLRPAGLSTPRISRFDCSLLMVYSSSCRVNFYCEVVFGPTQVHVVAVVPLLAIRIAEHGHLRQEQLSILT
jgi:hypothetical protein